MTTNTFIQASDSDVNLLTRPPHNVKQPIIQPPNPDPMKRFFLKSLAVVFFAAMFSPCTTEAQSVPELVNVSDVVPDVILEIRYYGTYNFVGRRIDGYIEPIAMLTRQAADSLRAVSDELLAQGYRLKIYDAYRPQRAVDHFVRWGRDLDDTLMKQYFYPSEVKDSLFIKGYIATKSGHSRGSTVDLTLFDMRTEKEVDMGGTFDWFGSESHPDCGGDPVTGRYRENDTVTAQQFANRMLLRTAMMNHGFKPFGCEWWHFTLASEPYPDTYFDYPVVGNR